MDTFPSTYIQESCIRNKMIMFKLALSEYRKWGVYHDKIHIFECLNLNVELTVKGVDEINNNYILLAEYWGRQV